MLLMEEKTLCSVVDSVYRRALESADQKIRVLHVDDEEDFLKTTKQILEMHSPFQVETAPSVKKAIKKLEEKEFDVIVSDYQMPKTNGLEFLNQLRENGNNIPFVLFTGRGREEVAIKALNLGADYYINKTGHPETVYPQLSHYILQAVQKRTAEERLRYKVDFESVIVHISSRFVNPADFDEAINESLADMGKISGASRVYIFLLRKNGVILDNMYEWCESGVTPQIEKLKNLPVDVVPWWMKQLYDGKTIHITDVSLMPPEAKAEKEILENQGIKSVVVLPIAVSGELVGFIGLDNVTKTGAWSSDDVALLQVASGLIGSSLERKKSEELYRTVFENTGTVMCIIEDDMTISMVNRRFEELSGYSRDEVEGKKWTDFVTGECLERMQRYHEARRCSSEKPPNHYSFSFITKNGQIKTGLLTIELMPGTNQSVASILDITERKKTEEKLKESERTYRLLTENVTDLTYIQDMNLNVTYVSPSVEKMSGYTPEELLKLRPDKFMTPESFERGVADFKEAISLAAEGRDSEIPLKQYEYIRKDGSTFWGELRMKLLRDSKNNVVGIQGTLRDITERKNAEESLNKIMKELMMINEKLSVVGKLTRHDARNKLSVIANNVYLAKKQLTSNRNISEYLDAVESAVDQMEKIFSFAKTYEMLGAEDLSYVNVKTCVDEAVSLFSGMNGIKLVNDCSGLTVLADSLLRQLFYNLIDNSLKYGEKVSQIGVYYERTDRLKLIYEDNGVGIPIDEKEKVFKERYGKGTGYGLYLIRKICEAYGWVITETGKYGKGAQFTMTIPKMDENKKLAYKLG
jgi:PAS domain S-box-containing protein